MKADKLFSGLRGDLILLLNGDALRYKSATTITKKLGCTYAYGTKIINQLVDMKLIRIKKVGRRNELYLTNKDQEISNCLLQYKMRLNKAKALYT